MTTIPAPLSEEEIAEIEQRANAAKHSQWTHSAQEGAPGHCLQAQVWDENGRNLAVVEPTLIPELATATAAHIAGLHPEIVLRLIADRKALQSEIARKDEALRPFAEILKHKFTDPLDWNDADGLSVQWDGKDITVGDLRRAAAAMEKKTT